MTRREERKRRREERKLARTKFLTIIAGILALIGWWLNRGDAQPAPAATDDAVQAVQYDPEQPLSSENYDPENYRVSKGEWGTHRQQNSRTGVIRSRKVWVPEGGLMRTKKRDFKREPQIPDQANRGGRACLS